MPAAALVLAFLATATGSAASPAPAETVDAFHDALSEGDRRKALELLAPDVLIFEQGRVERSRSEYARQHLGEDIGFCMATRHTVLQRAVKVHGDMAWVTSINRAKGRVGERDVDFTVDETMALSRSGGRWRIVHIHWSFQDKAAH